MPWFLGMSARPRVVDRQARYIYIYIYLIPGAREGGRKAAGFRRITLVHGVEGIWNVQRTVMVKLAMYDLMFFRFPIHRRQRKHTRFVAIRYGAISTVMTAFSKLERCSPRAIESWNDFCVQGLSQKCRSSFNCGSLGDLTYISVHTRSIENSHVLL